MCNLRIRPLALWASNKGAAFQAALLAAFLASLLATSLRPLLAGGESPAKLPAAWEIKSLPFVKQRGDWCGPAALASVLRFYGEDITQEQIAKDIYLPEFQGTLNIDLLLYARKKGFVAEARQGNLAALRKAIASGTPVICQVRERTTLSSRHHFVVVFAYDDNSQTLRMHSGSKAKQQKKYAAFDEAWKKADRWMLTIARPAGAGSKPAPINSQGHSGNEPH